MRAVFIALWLLIGIASAHAQFNGCAPGFCNGIPGGVTVPQGLVGNWLRGSGAGTVGATALDLSGNGNVGTIANAPSAVNSQIGQGLLFNGVNQSVTFPASASLDIATAAFSISVWVNFAALPAAGKQSWIFWKGTTDGSSPGYCLNIGNSAGTLQLNLPKFGTANQVVNFAFSTGVQYHIVAVQNFAAGAPLNVTFYVNNVVAGTSANQLTAYASTAGQSAYIGDASTLAAIQQLNATVNDLRAYNIGLTSTQVSAIYNAGIGGHAANDNYLRFANDNLRDPPGRLIVVARGD